MKTYFYGGTIILILFLIPTLSLPAGYSNADEPPLPSGLGSKEPSSGEPNLPSGLGPSSGSQNKGKKTPGGRSGESPPLPPGLGGEEPVPSLPGQESHWKAGLPFELTGFFDNRAGTRIHGDPYEKSLSLGESRLQVRVEKTVPNLGINVTTDFYYDEVVDQTGFYTDTQKEGYADIREANFFVTAASFMDIKAGRQILTWGVGDLIFINDLFPKDYVAFFTGRDIEYLKAPSDALKVSLFSEAVNLNIVYAPGFDPDRYITGRRLSYYNPALGRPAGRDAINGAEEPESWFRDDEIALRLYRNVKGYELALYGYQGFWKSPAGNSPVTGKALFPELGVYGASVRGNLLSGIASLETGYYDSTEDPAGDDPFIRNSEIRFLLGYEQELAREFTAGLQYYLEHMMDYDRYRAGLPPGQPAADENRHVLTLRLTKLLMNQDLTLSLFVFYSPSDRDGYVRPHIHYKFNDRWGGELGGNIFFGEDITSFFGQFENNSNVYGGVRYAF